MLSEISNINSNAALLIPFTVSDSNSVSHSVEIIMNTNSVVSGFLENECETELESDTVNGINKASQKLQ
jgi:hypothetical protein